MKCLLLLNVFFNNKTFKREIFVGSLLIQYVTVLSFFFFTSRVARDAKHIFDCLLYSYRCKASKGYVLKETCAWRVVEAYGLHHINLFLLFQIIALNVLLLNYGAET